MLLEIDLQALGIQEREAVMAFSLGAQRCDARALELSQCPKCQDKPDRYIRAAEILRNIVNQLAGE